MSTQTTSRTLLLGLAVAWLIMANEAVNASASLTYREYRLGLEARIEWPRVVFVWAVLAVELLAFAWLVQVVARTSSRATRALWTAGGLIAAVVLSLTVRMHGPEELNLPGRVALLLVGTGAVIGMAFGMRAVVTRIRAGTG